MLAKQIQNLTDGTKKHQKEVITTNTSRKITKIKIIKTRGLLDISFVFLSSLSFNLNKSVSRYYTPFILQKKKMKAL